MAKFTVTQIEDVRPVVDMNGKRQRLTQSEDARICDCCGKKIWKLHRMSNGDVLGGDCVKAMQGEYGYWPEYHKLDDNGDTLELVSYRTGKVWEKAPAVVVKQHQYFISVVSKL